MEVVHPWPLVAVLVFVGLLNSSHGNIFNEQNQLADVINEALKDETYADSVLAEAQAFESSRRKLGAFPCPGLDASDSIPTSVHQLRPSDIKVVAAIGDSYSAARAGGGLSPFNMLFDYRGNSWSIGGDEYRDFHTSLPNILRQYNPDIYGFSEGVGDRQQNLNVAITGARSDGFAAQANNLVAQLTEDPNVDVESDWKLITVFLGGNDLCEYCQLGITPEVYISNMRAGLDILYNNIPRAFVNLVQVMDVGLTQTLQQGLISTVVLRAACACGTYPETEEDKETLANYHAAFNQGLIDLVASGDYQTENFTIVNQRFFEGVKLLYKADTGELDLSFFAIDRFHISKSGHAVAGRGLWNSLFEPVGGKSTDVSWYETEIICPTEAFPFLLTGKNSKASLYDPIRRSFE